MKNKLKIICVLLISLLCVSAFAGQTNKISMQQLMQRMQKIKLVVTNYTQQRYFNFADEPILTEGVFTYRAPNYIEQKTTSPSSQRIIIRGNKVTIYRGKHQPTTVELSQYPLLYIPMTSFKLMLSGDESAIEKQFNVGLTGNINHWTVTLIPKNKNIKKQIENLIITGRKSKVIQFHLNQNNGDYVILYFSY